MPSSLIVTSNCSASFFQTENKKRAYLVISALRVIASADIEEVRESDRNNIRHILGKIKKY